MLNKGCINTRLSALNSQFTGNNASDVKNIEIEGHTYAEVIDYQTFFKVSFILK